MKFTYSESFAGIGAWGKALKRVTQRHNDTCKLKYYFEIDKYASNAYCAIHNEDESLNLWDITANVETPPVDIFFYSPPCQTFSIAGKQEGRTVAKGNLFDSAIQKLVQSNPKYAIMENVANLANQFSEDFRGMLQMLEDAGYYNYFQKLNSKDYGVPQNRERIFIISVRKDIYEQGKRFEFPQPFTLTKRIKDIKLDIVDEKYYLSQRLVDTFLKKSDKFCGEFTTKDDDDIANWTTTREGGRRTDNFIKVKSATSTGFEIAEVGDCVNFEQPNSQTRRGRVGGDVAQTLATSCNQGIIQLGNIVKTESFGGNPTTGRIYSEQGISPTLDCAQGGGKTPKILEPTICASRGRNPINPSSRVTGDPMEQRLELNQFGTSNTITSVTKDNLLLETTYRIRRLHPLECFRLQDFDDKDYLKAVAAYDSKWKPGRSDAQMYIRSGNSITVAVIEEILENLLYDRKQQGQISMF